MMGYKNNHSYAIEIEDVMRNLRMDDLVILYLLSEFETNQYLGLTFEDISQDVRIADNNLSRDKIYKTLDRLALIDAVGKFHSNKRYYYYIKKNGLIILKIIEQG